MEVAAQKKVKVPKLRFREFEDGWKRKRLDSVTEKITDGTHFSPPLFDEGNYKYISSKNIRNGYMILDDVPFVSDEKHKEIYSRCDVRFNDILLTKDGAGTGNVCLNELQEEFSLLSSVAMIRSNETDATNEFIYQYICAPYGQYEIRSTIAGQAITRITLEKLRGYKFYYPTLPEQQKIATFLSAVDARIGHLGRKKELLEQYKKGVMQRLFSSALEFVGCEDDRMDDGRAAQNPKINKSNKSQFRQLRFKREDGSDYEDWEEKRLGEVANINMGQSPDSASYNDSGLGFPLIQGNADIRGRVSAPRQWTSNPTKLCEIGDIILTVRAPVGFVAKSKHKACIGRGVCSISQTKDSWLEFLYQFLLAYEPQWVSLEQGSTFTAVSGTDIRGIKLDTPSKEEQQKIAAFLSGLDKKIEAVGAQIALTQQFKKGLLQEMFV